MKRNLLLTVLITYLSLSFTSGALSQKKVIVKEKTAKEKTGWLGVQINDLNQKNAQKLNLSIEEGALITEVVKKSPADSAGLMEDDVIVELDGRKIYDADDLVKAVGKIKPGTKTDVTFYRNNEKKSLPVVIGSAPKSKDFAVWNIASPKGLNMLYSGKGNKFKFFGHGKIGLELMELNKQLGEYFGAPNNRGVLVKEVVKDSKAEKAGFKAGDVIIAIGKEKVKKIDDIWDELRNLEDKTKAEFEVLRKSAKVKLNVELDAEKDEDCSFYFNDGEDCDINIEGLEGLENLKELKELENLKELEGLGNCIKIDVSQMHGQMEKMKPHLEKMGKELKNKLKHIQIKVNKNHVTSI